ncbi:MAG: hypothetical protein AB8D52_01175 [Gammaproteobacteria bacterium]
MNQFSIILVLMLLTACNGTRGKDDALVQINTVDQNNQPIQAEAVRWWFIDQIDTQNHLTRNQDNPSKWYIRDEIKSPIKISASASLVKDDDPECWDIFKGEATLNNDQKNITIKLFYSATVCK